MSSESVGRWTPGPWTACKHGDYGDYDGQCIVVLGDNDEVRVLVVQGINDAETRANAKLAAAAPDLAAVAIAVDEFDKADYSDLTDIRIALTALIAQARAALARAGVGQP